jgi:hypothetical protein
MQKYMATHRFPPGGFTRDQVCQFADAAQHDADVRGYRSFVNLSEGRALCVLEANSSEAVAAWFEKMGMPYEDIVPVELEGERGVIQDVATEAPTRTA